MMSSSRLMLATLVYITNVQSTFNHTPHISTFQRTRAESSSCGSNPASARISSISASHKQCCQVTHACGDWHGEPTDQPTSREWDHHVYKGRQLRLNQTIRQSEVILDRQIVIHQHSIHSDAYGQLSFFDQLSCTHECANDIRCREHVQFVKVHVVVHVIPHQQVGLNFRNTASGNRQMTVITDSKRAEIRYTSKVPILHLC